MIVALGLRLAIFRNHAIRLILVTVPFPDGPYSFETDAGRRYYAVKIIKYSNTYTKAALGEFSRENADHSSRATLR